MEVVGVIIVVVVREVEFRLRSKIKDTFEMDGGGGGLGANVGPIRIVEEEEEEEEELGANAEVAGLPVVIAEDAIPIHIPGTPHSPPRPVAGPASTTTTRPFRSISATVTHHGVSIGMCVGTTDGPVVGVMYG
jgi:hypothetical protein